MKRNFLLILSLCLGMSMYATDYKGTPYPNGKPHAVPGVIEAEDFDNGGEGVAYHDDKPGRQNGGGQIYRETDVDIQKHNGGFNIGSTVGGEWTKYTIDVKEDGNYSIETFCVSGSGNGRFHFEVDGKGICRGIDAPDGNWSDLSQSVTAKDIALTKGKHVLTWYTYGGMNVDKFVITRTGALKPGAVIGGNFNYPITKKMSNPLFVDFDSPMYGTNAIGALYTADPSAHVWKIDGKEILYVYASHDMEPNKGCDRMDRYHVFSTEDMVNWTDHGEILNSDDVRKQGGWGIEGFMWAPDCAYNPANKTYYFYFPHPNDAKDRSNTWRVGVATSKYPDREFKVVGWIEGAPSLIDPCVFIDDDGQPYIYNGGGAKCYGGKLRKDDWTKLDGEMKPMDGLGDFHEAAWVHKYKGKYYLSHSDNNNHRDGNQMKYAISDSPLGPWKDMGVYMYPTGVETNHGSIVEFKGKWYAFYHTGNYSGRGALRSVCVDPIEYNADGSIQLVQNYGKPYKGKLPRVPAGKNNKDVLLIIEAENYNDGGYHYAFYKKQNSVIGNNTKYRPKDKMMGISTSGNVTYLNNMLKGEWARYSITVEKAGRYDIDCVVSQNGKRKNGRFHIGANGHNRTGDIKVTGEPGKWETVTVKNVVLKAGEQYLDVRVDEGDLNLDKFILRMSEPYSGTPFKDHKVPGVIEAEDFDNGGQGVAFFDTTPERNEAGFNYRADTDGAGVDLQNNNGNLHLSYANKGEWTKYTFVCEEAGTYDIEVNVASNGGNGSLSLTFDDMDDYPLVTINTGGWEHYKPLTVKGVKLIKGKHVMTLNIGGSLNIDKFTFIRK